MKEIQQKTQSTRDKSQKDNFNHSKRTFFVNTTIHILYLTAKLALIAILLFTLTTISLPLFSQTKPFLRVQENLWLWEKQIIVEIRVVDSQICPIDFEDLTTYEWPGNIKGCYCSLHINLYKYVSILQGECGQVQFQNGCLSIPANQKRKFAYWSQGAHICVRKLKNYNFYASLTNFINLNNRSTKRCSVGSPYQIDLIDPIQCPITDMANSTLLAEQLQSLQFSYDRQSNYPIVYFRITQNNFCEQLLSDTVSPGRHANYIIESRAKFQCSQSDSRTIPIEEKSETQLFENNPKIKQKIEQLPGYPVLDEHYTYKLGFVRYPQWTYQCRMSSQLSLMNAKHHMNLALITPTITTCTYIIIFCAVVAFITIVLYLIDLYVHLRVKYVNGFLYLKDYQIRRLDNRSNLVRNRYNQMVKFVLSELFVVISMITLVIGYLKVMDEKLWIEKSFVCTSEPFLSYLYEYRSFYSSALVYLIASIFINISILILDVSHVVYRFCKGDFYEQNAKQEQLRQKEQNTQSTVTNEIKQINTHNLTQQNLIQNSFFLDPAKHDLQILHIHDQEEQSSQYSKSESA